MLPVCFHSANIAQLSRESGAIFPRNEFLRELQILRGHTVGKFNSSNETHRINETNRVNQVIQNSSTDKALLKYLPPASTS